MSINAFLHKGKRNVEWMTLQDGRVFVVFALML